MLNAELGPGAVGLEKHEFAHSECPDKVAVPTSSKGVDALNGLLDLLSSWHI